MTKKDETVLDEAIVSTETEVATISEMFATEELSEAAQAKMTTIFEAAVSEAVATQVATLVEAKEAELETQLSESVEAQVTEITENLNNYLDYVAKEWLEENRVAVESGIKVEMAESFMESLKATFYEHNVAIDEDTIDVVASLEEEAEESKTRINTVINENIELKKEITEAKADAAFTAMLEGLADTQVDRLKALTENLDRSDIDVYTAKLATIKEAFFAADKAPVVVSEEVVGETTAIDITEEGIKAPASQMDGYAAFLAK